MDKPLKDYHMGSGYRLQTDFLAVKTDLKIIPRAQSKEIPRQINEKK